MISYVLCGDRTFLNYLSQPEFDVTRTSSLILQPQCSEFFSWLSVLRLSLGIKAKIIQLPNQLVDLDDFFKLLWKEALALVLLVTQLSRLP